MTYFKENANERNTLRKSLAEVSKVIEVGTSFFVTGDVLRLFHVFAKHLLAKLEFLKLLHGFSFEASGKPTCFIGNQSLSPQCTLNVVFVGSNVCDFSV